MHKSNYGLAPKKKVNLLQISSENLPRVAGLQKEGSISPQSLQEKKSKPRDRWEEAAKTFAPGLDRELNQG